MALQSTYMVLDECLKLAALYLCHQGVGLGNLLCTLSSCCSSCGSCSGPSTATCSNSCSCARLLVPITADATNGCCSTNLQCKQDDLQGDHHSNRASCAAGTPTALMPRKADLFAFHLTRWLTFLPSSLLTIMSYALLMPLTVCLTSSCPKLMRMNPVSHRVVGYKWVFCLGQSLIVSVAMAMLHKASIMLLESLASV